MIGYEKIRLAMELMKEGCTNAINDKTFIDCKKCPFYNYCQELANVPTEWILEEK